MVELPSVDNMFLSPVPFSALMFSKSFFTSTSVDSEPKVTLLPLVPTASTPGIVCDKSILLSDDVPVMFLTLSSTAFSFLSIFPLAPGIVCDKSIVAAGLT